MTARILRLLVLPVVLIAGLAGAQPTPEELAGEAVDATEAED